MPRKPAPKPAVAMDPAAQERVLRLAATLAAATAEVARLGELPPGPELGRLFAAVHQFGGGAMAWYRVQLRMRPPRPRAPRRPPPGGGLL